MHEPMSEALMAVGQPSFFTSAARRLTGRARSGECGPTMCGSSSDRLISTTSSKYFFGSARTSGSPTRCMRWASASAA